MGTDSDRTNILRSAFLTYEDADGLKTFGYYRSKEGREFLRRLYEPYLRRVDFGDGKVASIIADIMANPDAEKREVDRTKSALRRWRRDGQVEIWPKEPNKNLRYFERIENEFASIDELREIMNDNAETIQKVQTGYALASFFYGSLPYGKTKDDIGYLHGRLSGLFRISKLQPISTQHYEDELVRKIAKEIILEMQRTGSPPESIDISPFHGENQFWDTREPGGGFRVNHSEPEKFIRLSAVRRENFMLAQEFELAGPNEDLRPRNVATGYAFPMADNTLHVFFSNLGPRNKREYLTCTPDETARPQGKLLKQSDNYGWRATRRPFSEAWALMGHTDEPEFWERIQTGTYEYTIFDVEKLLKRLDLIRWGLVP